METLVENKTVNLFEDKVFDAPSPFYTNEKMSFYKNRLIAVEEMVEIEDISSGCDENTKRHFDIFNSNIIYNLTFEDEQGNTHIQRAKKKPKQVGDVFYYVTNDDKLTHIAHETDKESLKQFICLNKREYSDYTGIKFKILDFIEKRELLFIGSIMAILIMDVIFCLFCLKHDQTSWLDLLMAASGLALPILSFLSVVYTKEKYDKEIDKMILDRKENIFKTFI